MKMVWNIIKYVAGCIGWVIGCLKEKAKKHPLKAMMLSYALIVLGFATFNWILFLQNSGTRTGGRVLSLRVWRCNL